jgi:ketosteroid isomerase-like protein
MMSDVVLPVATEVPPILQGLQDAINAHDLERLVGCFSEDYRNETPVHPSRSFAGAEQVRRNWTQILGGLPDLRAELVRWAASGDEVWAEWDWTGTRPDGAPFAMRGVTILGPGVDGTAVWSRFYMEPVDQAGDDVSSAVRDAVGTRP